MTRYVVVWTPRTPSVVTVVVPCARVSFSTVVDSNGILAVSVTSFVVTVGVGVAAAACGVLVGAGEAAIAAG
ncbi:hypothetical protein QP157_21435 [Sphingomonas sp. LR61]|uniref:hypothetical protein n=1 Tax=Sphingomonas sp. LR61 TaxID=3050234 RepID=UPI002FE2CDD5